MNEQPIKLIIAEDQELVSEAFLKLLNTQDEIKVLARVKTAEDAIKAAKTKDLNMILMDIELEGKLTGIDAVKTIKETYPNVKTLLFSTYIEKKYVRKAIKSGADGFISKNNGSEYLIKSIFDICRNGAVIYCSEVSRIIPECLKEQSFEFSEREIEVICFVKQGLTVKEIAKKMNLAYVTIEHYQKTVRKRLGLPNVGRLIAWANQQDFCEDIESLK